MKTTVRRRPMLRRVGGVSLTPRQLDQFEGVSAKALEKQRAKDLEDERRRNEVRRDDLIGRSDATPLSFFVFLTLVLLCSLLSTALYSHLRPEDFATTVRIATLVGGLVAAIIAFTGDAFIPDDDCRLIPKYNYWVRIRIRGKIALFATIWLGFLNGLGFWNDERLEVLAAQQAQRARDDERENIRALKTDIGNLIKRTNGVIVSIKTTVETSNREFAEFGTDGERATLRDQVEDVIDRSSLLNERAKKYARRLFRVSERVAELQQSVDDVPKADEFDDLLGDLATDESLSELSTSVTDDVIPALSQMQTALPEVKDACTNLSQPLIEVRGALFKSAGFNLEDQLVQLNSRLDTLQQACACPPTIDVDGGSQGVLDASVDGSVVDASTAD